MALVTLPRQLAVDSNGNPRIGAKAYVYQSGTTTPITAYTTSAYAIAHSSPVLSSTAGLFPAIYVNPDVNLTYKLVIKDAIDNELWSEDNIPALTMSQAEIGRVLYPRTAAEISAAVTPTTYIYPPGDIRRYGAALNGTSDDTAAVQNALNSNNVIFHPGGTCIVSTVSVPSNVTIYGIGATSIFKQKASTTQFSSVLNIDTVSNCLIRDLQIDGNGNNQPSGEHNHGVQIHDSTDITVENLTVHDMNGDSIYIASTSNSILTRRISVTGCRIYNLGRQGICVAEYGARNVVIANNHGRVGTYVSTSTSNGNLIHLELDSQPSVYVGDIVIQGNILNELGISVGGNYSNLAVIGNTVRPTIANGFGAIGFVSSFDVTCQGNTIIGNNSAVIDGIYFQDAGVSSAASIKNVSISGNVIEKVAGHGITISGTGSGTPSLGQVCVMGNILQTIGTGQTKSGILVSTDYPDVVVSGNIIKTVTNIGLVIQGCPRFIVSNNRIAEAGGSYGIYIDIEGSNVPGPGLITGNMVSWGTTSGKTALFCQNSSNATRISVIGNDFADSATPVSFGTGVTKSGSWANVLGNDTPIGTFTLGAAATTTVNNANVTATSKILLIPTNAAAGTLMGSNKALYISARSAGTSFTVATASGASAAGTETFEYSIY